MKIKDKMKWSSLIILCLGFMLPFKAQAQVPTPKSMFGFKPGAPYKLALYDQMLDYYKAVAQASDRVKEVDIGTSTGGRPMKMLIISSKENLQHLSKYRNISVKMAHARIPEKKARRFAKEGKVVVWVDMGLHANEMATAQTAPLLMYRLATKETPQYKRIRQNVILLLAPEINPDGLDIMGNWYLDHVGTPYEMTMPPWTWTASGVGHDNNRDSFMGNLQETKNVMKIKYRTWIPQIVHNLHQMGDGWTRIVIPPFSDYVNQDIPAAITAEINIIGSAMAERFALKQMPGALARGSFTMWWNGGMREVPYYHNQVGILTETSHNLPTPTYFNPDSRPEMLFGHPTDSTAVFYPRPWLGGKSTFQQAVNYNFTAVMALLNVAAQRKYDFLYNMYRMGRHQIAKGKAGNPYAYIIPTQQWDQWEATNLVNILYRGGVTIKQATSDFTAGGESYSAGSYIVYAAQAFRPYVIDLLDVQHMPHHPLYPGGPPKRPYDLAGWTLPMQMNVNVQRVNRSFSAATKKVTDFVEPFPGSINGSGSYGYVISDRSNVAAMMVNRLLANGASISRTQNRIKQNGKTLPAGSYIIRGASRNNLEGMAEKLGLEVFGLSSKPDVPTEAISQPTIGLYKSWIASMDWGWTHRMLKKYHFQVDSLHDAAIRHGNLAQYSAIILPYQRNATDAILNGYSIQQMPKNIPVALALKERLR